ncbi:hypothetical protein BC829DRAFT_406107, partial [Chytridium lagenaria]
MTHHSSQQCFWTARLQPYLQHWMLSTQLHLWTSSTRHSNPSTLSASQHFPRKHTTCKTSTPPSDHGGTWPVASESDSAAQTPTPSLTVSLNPTARSTPPLPQGPTVAPWRSQESSFHSLARHPRFN